jgi:general secretion pathway protein J
MKETKVTATNLRPKTFSLLFHKANIQYPESGFTLIEVLISLTLLTIVLGAVYSSFFSVQRALERFDTVSLKYRETRSALDMMRREIESALIKNPPLSDKEGDDSNIKAKAVFIMKDRDVFGKTTSFLHLTAFSFKGSNLNRVSYFVKETDGMLNLLKSEAPAALPSKEYEMEIIERIESFTVETRYNKKWVKTWNSEETNMLPETVRVTIEFDDNGKLVKMTEYAKPRIGTQL